MPRLWSATIQEHRSDVLDAILDATAQLVHRDGASKLTMTSLANAAGVGRATLYKYVPDTESAIRSWQEREMARHLVQLRGIATASEAGSRLESVLEAYVNIRRHRHEDAQGLHGADRLAPVEAELRDLVRELIEEDRAAGRVRTDVPADQLAAFAVASAGAAPHMPGSNAAKTLAALIVQTLGAHS